MNPYDRLQALIRNPNYLEDYQNYKKALKEYENALEDRRKQYRPLSEEEKKRIERTFSEREDRCKEGGNTGLPELPDIIEPTLDEYYQLDKSLIEPSEEPLLDRYGLNMLIDPDDVRKATEDDIVESAYLVFRDLEGWPVRVIKAREEEIRRGMARIDGEEIEVSDLDITPHLEYGKILKLEIDLLSKKQDIKSAVERYVDEYLGVLEKPDRRDRRERAVSKYVVWDLYKTERSFKKIAKRLNKNVDTIRKAYYRAFQNIMGEEYNPEKHNRRSLIKEELERTCDTCPERDACDTLCPQVAVFVNQDYRASLKEYPIGDTLFGGSFQY